MSLTASSCVIRHAEKENSPVIVGNNIIRNILHIRFDRHYQQANQNELTHQNRVVHAFATLRKLVQVHSKSMFPAFAAHKSVATSQQ